jgi:putative flippase GtrA
VETNQAERTLEVIRMLMERGTRYTHVCGSSGIAAGLITFAGCAVLTWGHLPYDYATSFVTTFAVVFVASFLANLYFTFQMARQNHEPFWSRPARSVALAFLPNFVAGVVLSVVMCREGRLDLLPGIWMLLYGCGALATSFFAPLSILVLGIAFTVAGILALLFFPGHEVMMMGMSFGGLHLAYGLAVSLTRTREVELPLPEVELSSY